MKLFGSKKQDWQPRGAVKRVEPETGLEEDLSELMAREEPKHVDRAIDDAHEAAHVATHEEITRIKLIEQGYCPLCSARIEDLLFTQVCPSCGWFRRMVPDSGQCVVYMDTGECVRCDRVFAAKGNQFLCVTDGVVRDQVMQRHIRRIEYTWEQHELEETRKTVRQRLRGVCSWCEKGLQDVRDGGVLEEYVAFGAVQERYAFCSLKCLEAFRKQYPPRVHRNCYETDCNNCSQCIKRYDTRGFKRVILKS